MIPGTPPEAKTSIAGRRRRTRRDAGKRTDVADDQKEYKSRGAKDSAVAAAKSSATGGSKASKAHQGSSSTAASSSIKPKKAAKGPAAHSPRKTKQRSITSFLKKS